MPDTDAALMTAFLHRANPMRARNIIDVGKRQCPDTLPLTMRAGVAKPWLPDHSFGRNRENA
jgi:hypothetical protein